LSVFVIDASATLPWCFADEATPATEALLERLRSGDEAVAPAHWPTEVMNALIMAVRRQRIGFGQVLQFAEALAALPIHVAPPSAPASWALLLTTAVDTKLTIYDAAYLQLARDGGVPLATLDRDLQAAARAASLSMIELA
jgi:predicted nucleic acid-binding protein